MTPADGERSTVRVLLLSPTAELVGGAERSLLDLLANPGIEAVLGAPDEGPIVEWARRRDIEVVSFALGAIESIRRPIGPLKLARTARAALRAALQIRRIARVVAADVVHSNGLKVHVLACIARLLGGPPVIVHLRDVPITRTERLVWLFLAATASRVVMVSRACWPGRWQPRRLRVIRNGIRAPERLPDRPRVRRPLTIGFVGRLHPIKGLHLLVDWVSACRDRGLDVHLVVRGEAAPGHEEYVEELRRTAVCRFDGRRDGMEAVYEGLDVVVVPSRVPDPLPRVVMECMSLGVPVIGYPAGGIVDMVRPGETGFLACNADELIAAIRDLTESERTWDRIRSAAWEWVRRHHSMQAMYDAIDREYAAVAG